MNLKNKTQSNKRNFPSMILCCTRILWIHRLQLFSFQYYENNKFPGTVEYLTIY